MTKWNEINDDRKAGLIPYYLIDKNNVCPKYFNDKRVFGNDGFKAWPPTDLQSSALSKPKETEEVDPYEVNKWLPKTDPNRISRE
jgi:ArsR family metal-binding transcriptional regulator